MKRIVIKIGSSSLVDDNGELDKNKISNLVKEISLLKKQDISPIIVSSGAIAVGKSILHIKPQNIAEKQALAAVGICKLIDFFICKNKRCRISEFDIVIAI